MIVVFVLHTTLHAQNSIDSVVSLPKPKTVIGVASFYSKSLDGTKTATGETFKNSNMTAASNNFKLNSWVKVTNLRNDKFVIVRINDRMHKKMARRGRVVDLSRMAAKELGFLKRGITKVKVETVNQPEISETNN